MREEKRKRRENKEGRRSDGERKGNVKANLYPYHTFPSLCTALFFAFHPFSRYPMTPEPLQSLDLRYAQLRSNAGCYHVQVLNFHVWMGILCIRPLKNLIKNIAKIEQVDIEVLINMSIRKTFMFNDESKA